MIFGKQIDKIEDDRAKKIRTLPVLIGERASRVILLTATFLRYVLIVLLVIIRFFTPAMLVTLVALPLSAKVFKVYARPRPDGPPLAYPQDAWPIWFVGYAFVHNRRFGGLFLLGLIADTVLILTGVFPGPV